MNTLIEWFTNRFNKSIKPGKLSFTAYRTNFYYKSLDIILRGGFIKQKNLKFLW